MLPKTTQNNYLSNLNNYVQTTGKRPKDIVGMHAIEIKRSTKAVMGTFAQQGRLYAAVGVMNALKSLAAHYEKPIKFTYSEKIRVGKIKNHIAPKRHEVYAIAGAASASSNPQNPRNRAIILMDWMTALRSNAIQTCRTGAIDGYSEDDCPIAIKVGNEFQRMGGDLWCKDDKLSGYGVDYYYTFLAKEGFLAVQEWINWRKRHIGPFGKEDYLFCQVHPSKAGKVGERMHPHSNWEMFKNALPLVGINRESMTFHKLRSAFKSVMIGAGVDEEIREVMMGHAPPGSQKNYFEFHDAEMARKEYKKADWTRAGVYRLDKVEQANMELQTQVKDLEKKLSERASFEQMIMKFMNRNLQVQKR